MSDDEQTSGGRMLRVGKKKDRPNWFMIAGGAVAMAVGVVFGRRRILSEVEKENENEKTSARTQTAFDEDDDTGSVRTYETVRNGTPYWDNSEAAEEYEYESPCFKTKRPAPSDPSPKVSKFCRQLSHNSVCQSNKETVYSDSHTSTALQAGLTARREMVHRLRQQILSRDAMIYDMQTQLSDQDQMIAMHRNHSVDLQDCVQEISTKLFEANLEIQKLHRELMAQHAKPIADLDEDRIDIAVAEIKRKWVHPKDVEEIVLEARKLNGEVERLEREKEVKESLAKAKSRQCELLCKKVSNLATELKELKTVAQGKQRLLEVKEQENFELANVLQDLQHKFEKDDRGNEWTRSSRLSRQTDPDVDRPATPTNCEEASSKCKGAADGNYQQTGSLRKSHGSVHARNDSQQDSEVSVAKAESTCASDAQTKRCEQPADLAARVDDHEGNEKIDRSLVLTFDHEVNQVASALSMTSKVVSEQMQAARRVLMNFQEHIGFQEHMSDFLTDAQPVRSVAQSGPQVCKGVEVSEIFSSLCEGMPAEQKQEMRDEFEQVAKQLDIEREMKVLSKHQTKLRELKSAVAKLTARFNVQNSEDDTSETEMLQLASSLSDIEQKLLAEEELAKQTFSCIQQLSTLFQLSSPQKPPVQEIWRTVTETTGNPISGNGQHKHFIRFTDEESRNILQKLDERTSSRTLERQDSSTSASRKGSSPTRLPTKPLDNPYQFQLGASSGPNSRPTRGRATLAAGRTSFRKPAESKRQSAEPSEQRMSFRVDVESNNGFSFGLSARDRPLDAHFSQAAESGSQAWDRMSSPEPESNTHLFNDQRFPSFSVSEPARFRPGTSPNFNTPAYDDRCSRFCSPQSPCFGITPEERPFAAAASSNSDQMKRSAKVDFSYNSNPDCSPRLRDNNASGSSVGVSPFAARYLDVRQPGSPVDSLCNFDRSDHHFEDEEDDGVSRVQSNSYNRDLESLCKSVSNLETKDSSGSCNPDEPRLFIPSLLRRSNSMNHQQ